MSGYHQEMVVCAQSALLTHPAQGDLVDAMGSSLGAGLKDDADLQAQALAPALRVCGVAPGLMFLSGPQTQDNFDRASRVNLLRQPIDPAQVAATCLFLAQNPCITGTTLCVDNGQHLVPLERDVMFLADTANTKADA